MIINAPPSESLVWEILFDDEQDGPTMDEFFRIQNLGDASFNGDDLQMVDDVEMLWEILL